MVTWQDHPQQRATSMEAPPRFTHGQMMADPFLRCLSTYIGCAATPQDATRQALQYSNGRSHEIGTSGRIRTIAAGFRWTTPVIEREVLGNDGHLRICLHDRCPGAWQPNHDVAGWAAMAARPHRWSPPLRHMADATVQTWHYIPQGHTAMITTRGRGDGVAGGTGEQRGEWPWTTRRCATRCRTR
jgi:hypothetical protein